jgi:hypothetical protein
MPGSPLISSLHSSPFRPVIILPHTEQ